jgi:ribosome-associated protein
VKPAILAKHVADLALSKKAQDVVIMNLRGLSSVTDFFVVCSGDSDVQIKSIADAVKDGLAQQGVAVWHREVGSPNWVLLDYVDVVVHVFHKHTRPFYNLEKLWGDAEIKRVEDAPPAPRRKAPSPKTAATTATTKKASPKKVGPKKVAPKKSVPRRKIAS